MATVKPFEEVIREQLPPEMKINGGIKCIECIGKDYEFKSSDGTILKATLDAVTIAGCALSFSIKATPEHPILSPDYQIREGNVWVRVLLVRKESNRYSNTMD